MTLRQVRFRDFEEFFEKATGYKPYPYQKRLATVDELPQLMNVPTGAGKTAAVVMGWLWRRRFASEEINRNTPRRLVYCLPMRVLVEQTHNCIRDWLKRLNLLDDGEDIPTSGVSQEIKIIENRSDEEGYDRISVHILMGGEPRSDWILHPERDAILVGTQDMILSRALNRGYGSSRYRWPVEFGLLNNDCFWVADEVQLMGSGLATTVQMEAFRQHFGTVIRSRTLWMSATSAARWFKTVDFDPKKNMLHTLPLTEHDLSHPVLAPRMKAGKILTKAKSRMGDIRGLAEEILEHHQPNSRTLVVLNTVGRCVDLYKTLRKNRRGIHIVLLHSRFRLPDRRKRLEEAAQEPGPEGLIIISTQVLEAGVDISSKTLFTELAPWPSLIQRFGRCNRYGEFGENASVFWIDLPSDKKLRTKFIPPYEPHFLAFALDIISKCRNVGPSYLPEMPEKLPMESGRILRRKDVLELFDTTPDLAGQYTDVSRFIREMDEHDLLVFWRNINGDDVDSGESESESDELCPVPVSDLQAIFKKNKNGIQGWTWNPLESRWVRLIPTMLRAGLIVMLDASEGRYIPEIGWDPKAKQRVEVVQIAADVPQGYEDDQMSRGNWETLENHSEKVVTEASILIETIALPHRFHDAVLSAARWHDAGKAHPVFQKAVRGEAQAVPPGLLAKSGNEQIHYERPAFRHELASGILVLEHQQDDIVAYLAASHHGKVRLSLRSFPTEMRPPDSNRRFARGIWDDDIIPRTELGGAIVVPETKMSLRLMELGNDPYGKPSWMARILALRDNPEIGPFRLAFLEALVRAADCRASRSVI